MKILDAPIALSGDINHFGPRRGFDWMKKQ